MHLSSSGLAQAKSVMEHRLALGSCPFAAAQATKHVVTNTVLHPHIASPAATIHQHAGTDE